MMIDRQVELGSVSVPGFPVRLPRKAATRGPDMSNHPQRICTGCKKPVPAHTEKCPNCGKDDVLGTQRMGVFITVMILMLLPLLVMFVVVILM
jgi:predicted nucleic acid-binding Zn ribbon protein